MWDLIVSVPGHCLSFYCVILSITSVNIRVTVVEVYPLMSIPANKLYMRKSLSYFIDDRMTQNI